MSASKELSERVNVSLMGFRRCHHWELLVWKWDSCYIIRTGGKHFFVWFVQTKQTNKKKSICSHQVLFCPPNKNIFIISFVFHFSLLLHQLIQTLYFVPIRWPPRQWSSSWRWVRESLFHHCSTDVNAMNIRCFGCRCCFAVRLLACHICTRCWSRSSAASSMKRSISSWTRVRSTWIAGKFHMKTLVHY